MLLIDTNILIDSERFGTTELEISTAISSANATLLKIVMLTNS